MSDQQSHDDPRPKPKYGELAPEGWTWRPPEDQDRLDTSRGADAERDGSPEGRASGDEPGSPGPWGHGIPTGGPGPHQAGTAPHAATGYDLRGHTAGTGRRVPAWNRSVTLVLHLVGLMGLFFSIRSFSAIPQSMQMLYSVEKLGTYHAPAGLAAILLTGQLVQGGLWIASVAVSFLLMVRQRLSFYVPLIAGAVAAIAFVVFIVVIIASDPALMNAYT